MKSAIICAICEKPKKTSDTYAVKITDYRFDKQPMVVPTYPVGSGNGVGFGQNTTPFPRSFKVKVCRTCAKKMGYKTKKVIKKSATPVALGVAENGADVGGEVRFRLKGSGAAKRPKDPLDGNGKNEAERQ